MRRELSGGSVAEDIGAAVHDDLELGAPGDGVLDKTGPTPHVTAEDVQLAAEAAHGVFEYESVRESLGTELTFLMVERV